MASYKDYMKIPNVSSLSESELRKAVRLMSSAANKRLRRMQAAGITYGNQDIVDSDYISGVRRFSGAGKGLTDLRNEFQRVHAFLDEPQASLTGMRKALNEFKRRVKRLSRKEQKEYDKMLKQKETGGVSRNKRETKWEELRRWRATWDMYNRLVEEGYYTPTTADSTQARNIISYQVQYGEEHHLSDEETFRNIVEGIAHDYERMQQAELERTKELNMSRWFSLGPSD